MDEEESYIESTSETPSLFQKASLFSFEDKSSRKRKHDSSPCRKSMKSSVTDEESNFELSSLTSVDSEHFSSDENKDSVIAQILKIVRNPESMVMSMDGHDAHNDFNRDKYARELENKGHIQFHMISNSLSHPVSDEILVWLVELRNLVSHELPKMPRSYITSLVFDLKHRNLVLIKESEVIGGICFRMFPTRDFSEIVFLAVSSSQHVKGYGTRMLNHLKNYHIKHKIHNLLTYADVNAFGYFQKHGFSSKISLHESVYQGYINIYQKATLMECQLDDRITYTEFSEAIYRQKMIVKKLIEDYRILHKESPEENNNNNDNNNTVAEANDVK